MQALLALLAAGALAGCDESVESSAGQQQSAPANPRQAEVTAPEPSRARAIELNAQGLGPLRVGADRAEIVQAMNAAVQRPGDPACELISSPEWPGVVAMIEAGKLSRVTLSRGSVFRTAKGIDVGASERVVRLSYPQLETQPHKYEPAPAKDMYDWQQKGVSGMRFEVAVSGTVAYIHAGGPSIAYVEGCG